MKEYRGFLGHLYEEEARIGLATRYRRTDNATKMQRFWANLWKIGKKRPYSGQVHNTWRYKEGDPVNKCFYRPTKGGRRQLCT